MSPDLSHLGYSPLSDRIADIVEEEATAVDGDFRDLVEVNLTSDQEIEIATMGSPAVVGEVERLEDIKDDVELSLSDLPVTRLTVRTMDVMEQRISDTHSKAKEYALGMAKMARKFPTLEQSLKLQYAADGKCLLKTVSEHEVLLLNKIYELRHAYQQPVQQGPGVHQPHAAVPHHMFPSK